MADIFDRLKYGYTTGSVMMKLIFINIAVFLCIKVIGVFFTLFIVRGIDVAGFFALPSDPQELLRHAWTFISYMFVHQDFWHILFNMLWLYCFGSLFMQFFNGRTLGSLYVLGGLAGAALYLLAFNTIPHYVLMGSRQMIGASAAVMAIVMGVSFYRPDMRLNLLLLGSVKIIYIALVAFFIDFLSLDDEANPGGHIAHIGGAIAGCVFALQYKKGRDITAWISRMIDFFADLSKPRRRPTKMNISYRRTENDRAYNDRKRREMNDIDAILDKLKQSGYGSLTDAEKKRLFDASKK
ncbi:MAG: rhomboid family intramembrane serine protease [Dysgonamonadaceae bacterium]|jgi:membrane associated rhomboid family serine protease|nr:rhomboid family intramembrane serine protease [Dysgonamonadaceae bacterium]